VLTLRPLLKSSQHRTIQRFGCRYATVIRGPKALILSTGLKKSFKRSAGHRIFRPTARYRLAAPTRPLPRRLSCARPIERCHLQRNEAPLSVLSSRPRSTNKPLGLAEDRASGAPQGNRSPGHSLRNALAQKTIGADTPTASPGQRQTSFRWSSVRSFPLICSVWG